MCKVKEIFTPCNSELIHWTLYKGVIWQGGVSNLSSKGGNTSTIQADEAQVSRFLS